MVHTGMASCLSRVVGGGWVPHPWVLDTYSTVIPNVTQLPILASGSDFIPVPWLQNGTEYELQAFIVASSLHNVSEFYTNSTHTPAIPDICTNNNILMLLP